MSFKKIYLSIFMYKFTLSITVLGLHSHLIATSIPHRRDSLYPHTVQVMISIWAVGICTRSGGIISRLFKLRVTIDHFSPWVSMELQRLLSSFTGWSSSWMGCVTMKHAQACLNGSIYVVPAQTAETKHSPFSLCLLHLLFPESKWGIYEWELPLVDQPAQRIQLE